MNYEKRELFMLEPHEMTSKELHEALQNELGKLIRFYERIARTQGRIASIRSQMSFPLKGLEGGGKTTPRKNICRIHIWDPKTNTRIGGHEDDWSMPTSKG
jgi:hypothetical protein